MIPPLIGRAASPVLWYVLTIFSNAVPHVFQQLKGFMKVAAVDIGSNSVHMVISRVGPNGILEVIDREKAVVGLGVGALGHGNLSPPAMERAMDVIRRYVQLARRHRVDDIIAVATSAVRETKNGGSFAERIEIETGIRVKVISGREEARLIYLGAREGIDFQGRKALIIDIGGGSVEIILGSCDQLFYATSVKLGVIRLTDKFASSDPMPPELINSLEGYILGQLESTLAELKSIGFAMVVGTSGTMLNLLAIALAQSTGVVPEKLNGLRASREVLLRTLQRIITSNRADRLRMPGLDPKRVDTIVCGAILTRRLLELLEADALYACDRALREGVIVDYVEQHQPGIRLVDAIPDLRRRSVVHLARRFNALNQHTIRVSKMSVQIFYELTALHRLAHDDAALLQLAGLLLDIGYLIEVEDRHKHAWYLIKNSHLDGFSELEREILANAVRYHRKGLPKLRHDSYAGLSTSDRYRVKVLGGILRLAAGLDRSKSGLIETFRCDVRKDAVEIRVSVGEEGDFEIWAANRGAELLAETLGVSILVTRAPSAVAESPVEMGTENRWDDLEAFVQDHSGLEY